MYDNMTMSELREKASEAADTKAKYDDIIIGVKAEIALRCKEEIDKAYKDNETGVARIVVEDIPLKLDRGKKVEWNQNVLKSVFKTLPPEIKKLFKVAISISETNYKKVEDDILKERLDAGRTVSPGNVKIDFEIKV